METLWIHPTIPTSRISFFFWFCFQVDSVDGKTVKVTKNVLPCTLDEATKDLIQLIFSNDMFKEAMECMNLGGCGSHKQVHEFCKHTTCMSSPVGWLHVSTHILVFSSRIIIIIIVIFLYYLLFTIYLSGISNTYNNTEDSVLIIRSRSQLLSRLHCFQSGIYSNCIFFF